MFTGPCQTSGKNPLRKFLISHEKLSSSTGTLWDRSNGCNLDEPGPRDHAQRSKNQRYAFGLGETNAFTTNIFKLDYIGVGKTQIQQLPTRNPGPTIYKVVVSIGRFQIFYIRNWLFHQTSIFNWPFGVPGCLSNYMGEASLSTEVFVRMKLVEKTESWNILNTWDSAPSVSEMDPPSNHYLILSLLPRTFHPGGLVYVQ